MTKSAAAAFCFLALVALPACGGASSTALRPGARERSKAWAGYILAGHHTRISASWVQPSVNCSVAPTAQSQLWQAASFWVGLDGYFGVGKDTVEQTGTLARCFNGRPSYHAWYEFYPGPSHLFSESVKPGDVISASVIADSNGDFSVTLTDPREGWKHSKSNMESGPGWPKERPTSAEVIAEAQTSPYGWWPPPLPDFGAVRFTGATADGTPLGDLNDLHPIYMIQGGELTAAPSPRWPTAPFP